MVKRCFLFVFLIQLVFASCTVTKRRYRKGYSIEGNSWSRSGEREKGNKNTEVAKDATESTEQKPQPEEKPAAKPERNFKLPSGFFPFDQESRIGTELGIRENAAFVFEMNMTYRSVGFYFHNSFGKQSPYNSMGLLWNFYQHGANDLGAGISIYGNPSMSFTHSFTQNDFTDYYMSLKVLYGRNNPNSADSSGYDFNSFGTGHFIPISLTVGWRIKY